MSDSNELEFSQEILEKYSNIKFDENSSSEAEMFHVDRRTDRQTHMTKLIVAFGNFANAPKKPVVWNPKFKTPSLLPILSRMNPVCSLNSYVVSVFRSILINIIITQSPIYSK